VVVLVLHESSCGTLTTNTAAASQSHRCQTRTPVAETSAIAMNASATSDVPPPTNTGARSAPRIPSQPTTTLFQRTAITVAAIPTRPAIARPTAGDTRS
jgi:hypothetical protein